MGLLFSKKQWSKTECLDTRRTDFGFCAHRGIIYVIGGWGTNLLPFGMTATTFQSMECFYPRKNTCEYVKETLKPRSYVAAVSCGEFIYALGGYDGKKD